MSGCWLILNELCNGEAVRGVFMSSSLQPCNKAVSGNGNINAASAHAHVSWQHNTW